MTYVLDLGFVAFESWWQVSAVTSLIAFYIVLNVIPAIKTFLICITEKDMIFEAPLWGVIILVPILGSIMGVVVWDENKWAYRILLLLTYLFLISVIGIGVEQS